MIYAPVKAVLLALLQAPAGPPEPPAGSPESVRVFRASKQYLIYKLLVVGVILGLCALPILALTAAILLAQSMPRAARLELGLVPIGFILFVLLIIFMTRLEYEMRYYLVTDRSLRIREGVATIAEITLTYANVQHLEIRQGPIQQMFGIADLYVRTAGGGGAAPATEGGQTKGHHGVLRGIDNAEEIRDLINSHLKQYRHAGLGDPEERRQAVGAAHGSPLMLQRLREIRDELRAWRQGGAPPSSTAITTPR